MQETSYRSRRLACDSFIRRPCGPRSPAWSAAAISQGRQVLGHHVARPLEDDRVRDRALGLEPAPGVDVAEGPQPRCELAEHRHRRLAGRPSVVVGAAAASAAGAGVHHHDRRSRRHRHRLGLERAAVEQERAALARDGRGELVHEAAVHPRRTRSRPSGRAAPCAPGPRASPPAAAKARAAASSSAAEDERPAPMGTSPSMTRSRPGTREAFLGEGPGDAGHVGNPVRAAGRTEVPRGRSPASRRTPPRGRAGAGRRAGGRP